jgi:aspartokinase
MFYLSQNKYIISKEVMIYLKQKPFVLEALEQEIINYSALARKINKDLGNVNFEAVKTTVIRIAKDLRSKKKQRELKIISLLKKADFSINNKIATIHHISPLNIESIAFSKTPSGYMYFVKENIAEKSTFKKIDYGYAIIHIKSPKEIEDTPGAAAFLLSTLASENINVVHLMDCREDTFLVIKEFDAPLSFRVLSEALRI